MKNVIYSILQTNTDSQSTSRIWKAYKFFLVNSTELKNCGLQKSIS